MPIDVVHWNPVRPRTLPDGTDGPPAPVDNFGDLIGPLLVERVLQERRLREDPGSRGRLLAVGSILHFAEEGDVVWGAGINGKKRLWAHNKQSKTLDVRAVRGPLTRELLLGFGNPRVPEVYGDPALLWSRFWPRRHYLDGSTRRRSLLGRRVTPDGGTVLVPNLNDWPHWADDPRAVDPCSGVDTVIGRIAHADLVCGSSLHAIVVAESFGIPARLIDSGSEPSFKYEDYYRGTGRATFTPVDSVADAERLGGEPAPRWDAKALLKAFPADLYRRR